MTILYAVLVLGVLAAIFGFILAVAAKVFYVEKDPREEAIAEVLPGANCGGCGYPGCGGYAVAVVKGIASVSACAAGGSEVAEKIASIMGVDAGAAVRTVAMVQCAGTTQCTKKKFDYVGLEDCLAATLVGAGGPNGCNYGCMGLGSCVKACPFDAMHIVDGIAKVDKEACVGCMACADACPKKLIVPVPYAATVTVPCNSKDKAIVLRKHCDVGCIGCKLCEKACEFDAIHVVDNVATIDQEKCTSCGKCVAKCPRKIIFDTAIREEEDAQAS